MPAATDFHRFLAVPLLAAVALTGCAQRAGQEGRSAGADDQEYAEAMSREHAEDSPTPSELARRRSVSPIEASSVTYAAVEGRPVEGFLATPSGEGDWPGVVLIHEWWGLNDNIEAMARQLAAEGYRALAIDLYQGRAAETPQQARELVEDVMAAPRPALANLQQAVAWLRHQGSPRVGVLGWCFGGGWALEAGLQLPVDAVVMYYGRVVTEPDRLAGLDAPLLGIFGAEDQGIPVDSVRRMEGELRQLGKAATIHVYEDAGHAFANPSGDNYQAAAAEDAWERTLAFLGQHLASSAAPTAAVAPEPRTEP